jgi:hypothetical protein
MIKIGGERRFFALLILLEFYESRVTNHWLEKWKNYRGNPNPLLLIIENSTAIQI